MKKLFPSVLPAMALLTLGSCAGTSALTSTTETDGVYYSQDRTTAVQTTTVASTEETTDTSGDVANPDYAGPTSSRSSGSSEYYDDDYYAARLRRFHQPSYRGLGLGYYDFAYTDPFWYGGPAYSFYDPFYSPYWGLGSYVNINIGFGRPWYRPWGGYGYSPYDYYRYNPYGYGFGRPWGGYYGGGFGNYYGGGYYGGGGYGGGGYFGGRGYDRVQRSVVTGTRSQMNSTTGGVTGNTPRATTGSRTRSDMAESGLVAPGASNSAGVTATPAASPTGGRGRYRETLPTDRAQPTSPTSTEGRVAEATPATTAPPARRWRVLSENNTGAATEAGTEPTRSRRAWDNTAGTRSQASEAGGTVAQPRRERVYQQPTRTYSESSGSSESSRSYSQPSRSYSEPSRSYSQPSRSFDGGGNSGGSSGTRSSGGGGSSSGGRGRGN
ncbi:hypothetical protein MUN84_12535 [Hymenobacter sp. 5516J-16]|uniref:hypothetical protein n=1 Tax=Hymenobacter sp. 5516J-16 TaxID=2932253 RepID=UPI001FD614DE|nr:hypothetical protein [Hymenobacter sp. 5516J-16]UOQ75518.1 hypothetical protein MUN84_12535 [Hymenobacter sp. 5516J-16]